MIVSENLRDHCEATSSFCVDCDDLDLPRELRELMQNIQRRHHVGCQHILVFAPDCLPSPASPACGLSATDTFDPRDVDHLVASQALVLKGLSTSAALENQGTNTHPGDLNDENKTTIAGTSIPPFENEAGCLAIESVVSARVPLQGRLSENVPILDALKARNSISALHSSLCSLSGSQCLPAPPIRSCSDGQRTYRVPRDAVSSSGSKHVCDSLRWPKAVPGLSVTLPAIKHFGQAFGFERDGCWSTRSGLLA
ncbi:hypothetical protein BDV93DRAFT_590738 [Ceratobasidium sp. AG-I]|nr:hypothetical protein BDV93DRAFT_590738 [Ceratobasidium sp. AG-I]